MSDQPSEAHARGATALAFCNHWIETCDNTGDLDVEVVIYDDVDALMASYHPIDPEDPAHQASYDAILAWASDPGLVAGSVLVVNSYWFIVARDPAAPTRRLKANGEPDDPPEVFNGGYLNRE